jgi:hypothetical protein
MRHHRSGSAIPSFAMTERALGSPERIRNAAAWTDIPARSKATTALRAN